VAVKSSEKDDIEGLNLFARNCPIRYIITKQALQEGWDCAFAYLPAASKTIQPQSRHFPARESEA